MYQEFATAQGPADISGIDVHTIWNVDADDSYDIGYEFSRSTSKNLHAQGGTGLIAIYTLEGTGLIEFSKHKNIEPSAESLLLIEWTDLLRYRTKNDLWRFWWFEFTVAGPLNFPMYQLMKVTSHPDDKENFTKACRLLRRNSFTDRCFGSSIVMYMLYRWLTDRKEKHHPIPYQVTIEKVIDLMHEKVSENWTVQQMAEKANMSERNFRQVFHKVTGQSPKKFYNKLRLTAAKQILTQRIFTVTQVARMFGFSSAFHFSREFNRQFGIRPSKIR